MSEHHQDRNRHDLAGGTGTEQPADMDEEVLRRLLHDVMDGVEPSPGSLEEIRRAVPVRRARRRQALVGAAACVLLVGAAVPALVHVAGAGSEPDRSATAASSRQAESSAGSQDTDGGGTGAVGPTAGPGEGAPAGAGEKDGRDDAAAGPAGAGVDPEGTMAATSPTCIRAQLGQLDSTAGEPGENGKIYGSFRVVNRSDSDCTVTGRGFVSAVPQGGTESSEISVVDHTSGDAADGLPDPTTELAQLILKPGQSYVVKFAWVPAGGGPGGCRVPDSSPTPSSSSNSSEAASPSNAPAADEPATEPTGSIVLSHTPQSGDPSAGSVTIQNACAGTVYRTGVLSS